MCFHKGRNKEWQDVEDFARSESCDKEENTPVSRYKVAVSSFQYPQQILSSYMIGVPLVAVSGRQVCPRADHCPVRVSCCEAVELNLFRYVLNVTLFLLISNESTWNVGNFLM